MKKVYVLICSTGAYEDRIQHTVAVYEDKEEAQKEIEKYDFMWKDICPLDEYNKMIDKIWNEYTDDNGNLPEEVENFTDSELILEYFPDCEYTKEQLKRSEELLSLDGVEPYYYIEEVNYYGRK